MDNVGKRQMVGILRHVSMCFDGRAINNINNWELQGAYAKGIQL